MKSLTIFTDLDDVLWDLCGLWIAELNRCYGTHVMPRDVTDWEIAKFFPGLTSDQVFAPLHNDNIWQRILPIANSATYIQRLMLDGHKVRVLTATHPATVPAKIKRFLELFPMFKWEDVIIASDKGIVYGDVMIDDGTHNLVAAIPNVPHLFLFDRPHNRDYDEHRAGLIRVRTWEELYGKITRLAEALA